MNLELLAMRWLRWKKRCVIVITERSPRELYCGHPDVLGMTKDRYLYEIEVKRSMADFRADGKKRHRKLRDDPFRTQQIPKQTYYLVPNDLADIINGELPEWAGLMRGPGCKEVQQVYVVKQAPIHKPSTKLTPKECAYLVVKMANQIISLAENKHAILCRHYEDDGWDGWQKEFIPEYNNFHI